MKYFNYTFSSLLAAIALFLISTPLVFSQFNPGEGGQLPSFPSFTIADGKIGCLIFQNTQRTNGMWAGGGSRSLVEMQFPEPSTIGAESYNLEVSDNNGQSWSNYQHYYEDLVLTGDNFSLSPDFSYTYRLKVNGGPKNGFTSNEVYAELSGIDSRFGGWSLDEGMIITGIMAPNIRDGLEASFTVLKISDGTEIKDHLSYQWYRVNPLTYEMAPIEGANALIYATVIADAGHYLAIRATGNNIDVGGSIQIMSRWPNQVSNNSYVQNVSTNGFNLYLHKGLESLEINDLTLRDIDYNEVPISEVQTLENSASFRISANIDPSKTPYKLVSKSDCWRIVSQTQGMHMAFEGVSIDFNTSTKDLESLNSFVIENNVLIYNTSEIVSKIRITDTAGKLILEKNPLSSYGKIQIETRTKGVLIIQYEINGKVFTQKAIII